MSSSHHVEKATNVGDPQCFKGEAPAAKFKVGDRVRIRNLPDIFYTRSQMYLREAEATVVKLVYESPPAEDEAWDNTDSPEWAIINLNHISCCHRNRSC